VCVVLNHLIIVLPVPDKDILYLVCVVEFTFSKTFYIVTVPVQVKEICLGRILAALTQLSSRVVTFALSPTATCSAFSCLDSAKS